MSMVPTKILKSLASKPLKWHNTEQVGYFLCEEQSGKKTFLTPADLFRIDPRLPATLQWYGSRYSPENIGELLQRTMRFWLSKHHLPWSAPGLSSPFCLMTEVLGIEHFSQTTSHFKIKGIGVGLKHCHGHQIVVEHTTGSMSYSVETLAANIPGFMKRLEAARQHPPKLWHGILFTDDSPLLKPVQSLPDDIAAAYDGLLF